MKILARQNFHFFVINQFSFLQLCARAVKIGTSVLQDMHVYLKIRGHFEEENRADKQQKRSKKDNLIQMKNNKAVFFVLLIHLLCMFFCL